jgi:PP-loop superfamily ATP-utilizing enzyme
MSWRSSYIHTRTGTQAAGLRQLLPLCNYEERRLSGAFFERYLAGLGMGSYTALSGVARTVSRMEPAFLFHGHSLYELLTHGLRNTLDESREVAVAVSGGIDSWVLAAILKSLGVVVRGWYLESGVAGYCEREQVDRFAFALDTRVEYLRVSAGDFVEGAADFVAVTGTPIYNLHPVSKLLLARELRRHGVGTIVTGDGADQVMRGENDCDLIPLAQACFDAAGVEMVAPFMSLRLATGCVYPDKRPVRDLAERLGIPLVEKRAMLFPEVALPRQPREPLPVSAHAVHSYAYDCLSYTTGLLTAALEDRTPCAALQE